MYNIVLVHVGDFFYEHINDNISHLLRYNNNNIHLLISKIHKDKIKHNVNLVFLEDIKKSDEHIEFLNGTKLNSTFRGGFWKFASERFYYINDFLNETNYENVIHLENDYILYFEIEKMIHLFEDYKIGVTFDNDIRCIPGFMFIKNNKYLTNLIKYIVKNRIKDDMHVISDYRYISNEIMQLPIIYNNYNDVLNNIHFKVTSKSFEYYSNNFDLFQSVFDAACLGQYLGGIDPRNKAGNTEGFINETCVFDPSRLNIIFKLNENNLNEPFIQKDGKLIKINSLHMHCKNLNKFI